MSESTPTPTARNNNPIDDTLAEWLRLELRAQTGMLCIETSNESLVQHTITTVLGAENHAQYHWTPVAGESQTTVRQGHGFTVGDASDPMLDDVGLVLSSTSDRDKASDLESYLANIDEQARDLWPWRVTPDGLVYQPTILAAPDRDARNRPATTQRREAAVRNQQSNDPVVQRTFVLYGAETWLAGNHADPIAIRHCYELMRFFRRAPLNLILVLPSGTRLPDLLLSTCSWYTDDLPDRTKLANLWDVGFTPKLRGYVLEKLSPVDTLREPALDRLAGLTLDQARNALTSSAMHSLPKSDSRGEFLHLLDKVKERTLKDSAALEIEKPIPISRIGGLDLLKTWLEGRAKTLTPAARERGIPSPRGAVFLGPAGSGKSACAKATSSVLGLPLVRFDVGAVFGSLVGESEEGMRRALRVASAMAPCVLFLDEIEKAFGGQDHDGGTAKRVFGSLLSWMADRDPLAPPVFVVATANDVTSLPPELLRKGRFDAVFFVDLPNEVERRAILEIHLKLASRAAKEEFKVTLAEPEIKLIAQETDGFTGAEIEAALTEARVEAFRLDESFGVGHMLAAVRRTVPLSVTRKESLDALRAWATGRTQPASSPLERPKAPRAMHPNFGESDIIS